MMVAKVSGTSAAIGHFQSRPKKAFTVGQPSSEQEATSKRACEGWDYQRTLGRQRGEIARRRIRRRPYCGSNRLLRHFPVGFGTRPEVSSFEYWFMMQIAMTIGFFTSYPANWWLITRGFKEKM